MASIIDRLGAVGVLLLVGCEAATLPDGPTTSQSAGSSVASTSSGAMVGCVHPAVAPSCVDGECLIPPGCYVMGAPDTEYGRGAYSEKQIEVTLTRPFFLGSHEVTQGEWTAMGYPNRSGLMPDGMGDCVATDCPVGNVTRYEALAYLNALSTARGLPECYALEGCKGKVGDGMVCAAAGVTHEPFQACAGYRLPTRAEWEYAARAGTTTAFYSGDISEGPVDPVTGCESHPNLDPIAWYCNNAGGTTHPVELLQPNGWGLYDTLGNANEWTQSRGSGLPFARTPMTDPIDPEEPNTVNSYVAKGGLYFGHAKWTRAGGVALSYAASGRGQGLGFRIARTQVAP